MNFAFKYIHNKAGTTENMKVTTKGVVETKYKKDCAGHRQIISVFSNWSKTIKLEHNFKICNIQQTILIL